MRQEQPTNQQTTSHHQGINDNSNSKVNTEPAAAQPRDQADGQMSRPGRGRWCSVISPPVPCLVFLRRKRREPVGHPDTTRLTSPPAVAARAPAARASLAREASLLMPRATLVTMRGSGSWCSRPRRRSQSLATAHLTQLDRRRHLSSQHVPCRDTHFLSFVGCHFASRTAVLGRGAAAPTSTTSHLHQVAARTKYEVAVRFSFVSCVSSA